MTPTSPWFPRAALKFEYAGEMIVSAAGTSPGLYYIGARWMDPELGRWLSLDPELGKLSMPQTLNRYVCCGNNPLRFTDPTGAWFGINLPKISLKTIAIIAVCVAATVLIPGAGGFVAGIVISAATQGGADFISTLAETGSFTEAAKAGVLGAAEGAIAGALGGGIGKVVTAGLKSVVVGSAKSMIQDFASTAGSVLRGGISRVSPVLGARLEQVALGKSTSAGFRALQEVEQTGLPTNLARELDKKILGEQFDMSLVSYGRTLAMERAGYTYRAIVKTPEVTGGHLLVQTTISIFSG